MEPYPDQLRHSVADYQVKTAIEPHQARVIEERDALKDKIDKLEKFLASPMCGELDFNEQMQLHFQFLFMSQYHMVLCERIGAFTAQQPA